MLHLGDRREYYLKIRCESYINKMAASKLEKEEDYTVSENLVTVSS